LLHVHEVGKLSTEGTATVWLILGLLSFGIDHLAIAIVERVSCKGFSVIGDAVGSNLIFIVA